VLFLLSLLFVLGGIWMIRDGATAGYFCAGFFALGLLVFPLRFHPKAAYLRLAPEGFTFCALFRTATVPWTQICEFRPTCVGGLNTVGWNYTPDYQPARRVRRIVNFLCGCEATLPDTYGMKPQDLAALMESLRQQYASVAQTIF